MKLPALHWQILTAFILAIFTGIFFPAAVPYVDWMGTVFIRLLKMVIIPLILSSIISGLTNIGSAENLGRLGLKTIAYYMLTSLLAITTGLVLVNILKPGVNADLGLSQNVDKLGIAGQSFGDTLLKVIPDNIFASLMQADMLGIIFFALIFGFFITRIGGKHGKLLSDFFNAVFEVMMKITLFIIRFTPLGVFGIVAGVVASNSNLLEVASRLSIYMAAVLAGLFIHATVSLPLLVRILAKVNPFKHFSAVSTALLTAFSTSSSSATLPLTMTSVENNDGVSNKISSFTLPLGATINMDGTALYEIVAAIFIAQAYGLELTLTKQIIVVFTALLASIGAAGIPMAGLVMISVILSAIGLPLEGVGLILAVDRILDMFRTSVNVWSDTCGAVIIAKSEGEELKVKI